MNFVVLICPQGHRSAVPDEYAGRTARCPFCQALMVIPPSGPTTIPAPTPVAVPPPAPPPPTERAAPAAPSARPPVPFPDFEIHDPGLVPVDKAPGHVAPGQAHVDLGIPTGYSEVRPIDRPPEAASWEQIPMDEPADPEVAAMDRALDPAARAPVPVDEYTEFEEAALIPDDAPLMIPDNAISEAAYPLPGGDEPAVIALRPNDDVADRPVRRRRRRSPGAQPSGRKSTKGLPIVNLGLGFHYVRLVVLVGALVLFLVTILTYAAGMVLHSNGMLGFSLAAAIFLLIFLWLLPVLGLTGSILCLWVPRQARALPLVIISLGLDALQLPFVIVLTFAHLGPTGTLIVQLFGLLLSVGSWVFFMVFLAVLARYIEEPSMESEAYRLITKGIIMLVSYLLMQIIFRAIVTALFPKRSEPLEAHVLFLWWLIFSLILAATIAWVIIIARFLFEIIALIGSLRQVILSRW